MTTKTNHLTKLCDDVIARLERAKNLIQDIHNNDTASANAAAWLRGQCRFIPYEGSSPCFSVDPIFTELAEMEADEVFGPREGR
jgi:hypothetical protein